MMGARASASGTVFPSASREVNVEENASPAPVREIGGVGSGYIGIYHTPSSVSANEPFGPSVMTGIFGPKACMRLRSSVISFSSVSKIVFASSLLQKKSVEAS
jgi:hypothetical protein